VQQTIRTMVDNDVAMTSTLAVYELFVPNRPQELDQRMLEAMSPETREEYLATRRRIAENPRAGIAPEVFRTAMDFERAFVEAGGLLAAGVDPTGNGGALPGFGDQRNLELLVEAGFDVPQAIRIMTLNGAIALGVDDQLGSIEVGKIADLAVVQGNPVADPAGLRNTTIVFKDGVGYDSAKLLESVKGAVVVR
jgi:hypothetical protein